MANYVIIIINKIVNGENVLKCTKIIKLEKME